MVILRSCLFNSLFNFFRNLVLIGIAKLLEPILGKVFNLT